jgi:hypothetical protein
MISRSTPRLRTSSGTRHHGAADLKRHRLVSYVGDLLSYPELDVRDEIAPEGSTAFESSNLVTQLKATRRAPGCACCRLRVGAESGLSGCCRTRCASRAHSG